MKEAGTVYPYAPRSSIPSWGRASYTVSGDRTSYTVERAVRYDSTELIKTGAINSHSTYEVTWYAALIPLTMR